MMLERQTYSLRLIIDKLSIRERYLVIIVLAAVVLLCSQGILMLTGLDDHSTVIDRIEQKQAQTTKTKAILQQYIAALNNPEVAALEEANRQVREKLENLERNINEINSKLMSPNRMNHLLKELINSEQRLAIQNFHVLPVKTVESSVDGGTLFYQHGIHMELEGEFEALTDYLSKIEESSHQLFWDNLVIETVNFPILNIQLDVHTLSQNEEWLNV